MYSWRGISYDWKPNWYARGFHSYLQHTNYIIFPPLFSNIQNTQILQFTCSSTLLSHTSIVDSTRVVHLTRIIVVVAVAAAWAAVLNAGSFDRESSVQYQWHLLYLVPMDTWFWIMLLATLFDLSINNEQHIMARHSFMEGKKTTETRKPVFMNLFMILENKWLSDWFVYGVMCIDTHRLNFKCVCVSMCVFASVRACVDEMTSDERNSNISYFSFILLR